MLVSMCMRIIFILFALWHDQPAGAFLSIPREKLEVSKLDVRRRRSGGGAAEAVATAGATRPH